ncbi:outer membrane lipoprotein-sorting protein [Deltaproteobacteria bacterium TL4]
MKTFLILILAAAALSVSSMETPAAETADEIMEKAHLASYYAGEDGRSTIAMLVYAKGEDKPLKKIFTIMKKDLEEGGRQNFFIYFMNPADIQKTTFLVHKYVDQEDYRRLYLPASDKVIPIDGSRKQDPFMGSDFSYEDISGRHFKRDHHKNVGEETLQIKEKKKIITYETQIIESVPKVKEEKTAKIKTWVEEKTYTPLRVEFTNHAGKVYKIFEAFDILTVDGFPTMMKRVMTSPLEGTMTVILLDPKRTNYNVGMPEEAFLERSLRFPPMKYLR